MSSINKKEYLNELIRNCLIPKINNNLNELRKINYTCYFVKIFYPNIFKDVKSCINSAENNQNENVTCIINYLKDVKIVVLVDNKDFGRIDNDLECGEESIHADIFFHPSVRLGSDTYSFIDEIYRNEEDHLIERNSVLVSRILKIQFKKFNSLLKCQ